MFRKRIATAGLIAVTSLLGGTLAPSSVQAQVIDLDDDDDDDIVDLDEDESDDTVIDLDEDEDESVVAGQGTSTLSQAQARFQKKSYGQAAKLFYDVVSGVSGDDPGNKQIAEFQMAQSLYYLRFYQASFDIFSSIADTENHLKHSETLPWLAKLSLDLPEPADIISSLGKYSEEDLSRFNSDNKAQQEIYWKLNYFLGRYHYRQGDFETSIKIFSRVSAESAEYVKAQFFSGVSYIQLRKAVKAVEAFQRVETAVDEGADVDDTSRMRDLARLSMARTYYSSSIQLDPETNVPAINPDSLSAAVKYWNMVEENSEYWLDAVFEEAWAYYMAGQYTRAMGNIHTLKAPYFPKAFYPEADILKSIVFFFNCDYEGANVTIARFKVKTEPLREKLDGILKQYTGENQDEAFYQFLLKVRDGEANLDADVEPLVETALSDRQLLRNIAYVEYLDNELEQFDKAIGAFREAPIGAYVQKQTQEARAAGVKQAGALARSRYQRYVTEMDEHLRNSEKVLIDITAAQRNLLDDALKEGQVSDAESVLFGVVNPDDEHFMWEFDGEYWRDELGFYRQEVESACGR